MDCLVLQTKRIILRQFRNSDFDDYFRLESHPKVMRYISRGPRSRIEIEERFEDQRKEYLKDPGFGIWAVCLKENAEFIGTANLNFIPQTSIRHIGYKILPNWQGKGLATELVKGLLDYGFGCCRLSSISAVCHPENKASERIMQKSGMAFRGQEKFLGINCLHYRIESKKWFL